MGPTEFTRGQQINCDSCSQITPSYDIVNYGSMEQGYRRVALDAFELRGGSPAGYQFQSFQLLRNSILLVISSIALVAISLSNLRICSPTE